MFTDRHRTPIVLALVAASAMLATGCGFSAFPDWAGTDASGDFSTDAPTDVAWEDVSEPPELESEPGIAALAESEYVAACDVETEDPNGNGTLDPGEKTRGKPKWTPRAPRKDVCSRDVELRYRTCLVERDENGEPIVSRDFWGEEICGEHVTPLRCEKNKYVPGSRVCVNGRYCDLTMSPAPEPMVCGWRIVELGVFTEDGEELEDFEDEALEELGFEYLEVSVQ